MPVNGETVYCFYCMKETVHRLTDNPDFTTGVNAPYCSICHVHNEAYFKLVEHKEQLKLFNKELNKAIELKQKELEDDHNDIFVIGELAGLNTALKLLKE